MENVFDKMTDNISQCQVAVDWGSSFLRIWLVDAEYCVLDSKSSGDGATSLTRDKFEPVLEDLIRPWQHHHAILSVLACGMVGAKDGWHEAPYRSLPCSPAADTALSVATRNPTPRVFILPGLAQTAPCDVMRGEETQLAGLLLQQPEFEGVVCLPGTHSKWVRIQKGQVVEFSTVMSGEIFALLRTHSVLRHAVASAAWDEWDEEAFCAAVQKAANNPQQVAGELFAIRAESLLCELSTSTAKSRLSGMLLGLEFAAMQNYWAGKNNTDNVVAVLAADNLGKRYAVGLQQLGLRLTLHSAEEMVLAGLIGHLRSMKK